MPKNYYFEWMVDTHEKKNKPLILSILKLPLLCLKLSLFILIGCGFLPLYIVSLLCSFIILSSVFQSGHSYLLYVLLCIPRWIIGNISIVLFALPSYFLVIFCFDFTKNEPVAIQYITALSLIILQMFGIFLGLKCKKLFQKYNLPWIEWKNYLNNIVHSYLDILFCFVSISIALGILQVWNVIDWIRNRDGIQKIPYRVFAIVQFVLTILNIICIIPLIVLCIFPWRLKIVLQLERDKYNKFGPFKVTSETKPIPILRSDMWKPLLYSRAIIVQQFLQAIIDIPYILMLIISSLTLWRIMPLWRDIINPPKDKSIRSIIMNHFIGTLFDLPILPIIPILLISGIKTISSCVIIQQAVSSKITYSEARYLLLESFICIFLDVISFIMVILLLLTSWHSEKAFQQIRNYSLFVTTKYQQYYWNFKNLKLFLTSVIDIPFIIFFVLVYLSGIHTVSFHKNYSALKKEVKTYTELCTRRRAITLEYFLCLLLDPFYLISFIFIYCIHLEFPTAMNEIKQNNAQIVCPLKPLSMIRNRMLMLKYLVMSILDIPLICFLAILSFTSPSRTWRLVPNVFSSKNRNLSDTKILIVELFVTEMLQFPSTLFASIIFITRWRRKIVKKKIDDLKENTNITNEIIEITLIRKIQQVYVGEGMNAICDIPAIICYVITLITFYRFKDLNTIGNNYWKDILNDTKKENAIIREWRNVCYLSILKLFCDPFIVVFSIVIFCFIFHAKEYKKKFNESTGMKKHGYSLYYFLLTLIDIPFIIMILFVFITHWRWSNYNNHISSKEIGTSWLKADIRREAGLYCFLLIIIDCIAFPAEIFIKITRWNSIQEEKPQNVQDILMYQLKITKQFMLLLVDTPYFIAMLLCICSWRMFQFHKAINGANNVKDKKLIIRETLFCIIIDPMVALCYLLIWIQRWRVSVIKDELKKMENDKLTETEKSIQFHNLKVDLIIIWMGILSLQDIPASLVVIFLCFTWRITLLMKILDLKLTVQEKQQSIFSLFRITLLDIPSVLGKPIIYLTWWYLDYFKQEKSKMEESIDIRKLIQKKEFDQILILKCCIYILFDIPTIIVAIIVFCLYLKKKELQKLLQERPLSMRKRRKETWELFFISFATILIKLECLFLKFTVWRALEIEKLEKLSLYEQVLKLSFHCICILSVDIPFILMSIFVVFTWRRSSLVNQNVFCKRYNDFRYTSVKYFIIVFLDILALLMSIQIIIFSFGRKTKKIFNYLQIEWNYNIQKESSGLLSYYESTRLHWNIFILYCITSIDFIFLLPKVILFIFHWRWMVMKSKQTIISIELEKLRPIEFPKPEQKSYRVLYFITTKLIILQQITYLFCDFLYIIPLVFILPTWRGKRMVLLIYNELQHCYLNYESIPKDDKKLIAEYNLKTFGLHRIIPCSTLDDSPNKLLGLTPHFIILEELFSVIIDIPFVILLHLLLWRLPLTISKIWNYPKLKYSIRKTIFKEFIELLIDMPYAILCLWNILCFWKWKWIVICYWNSSNAIRFRRSIFYTTLSTFYDIMSMIISFIFLITIWKIPRLISAIKLHYWAVARFPNSKEYRYFIRKRGLLKSHYRLFYEFIEWMKDIPYIPFALFLLLCPYRLYICLKFIFSNSLESKLDIVEHCKQVLRTWHLSEELKILNKIDSQRLQVENMKRKKYYKHCRTVIMSCFIMGIEDYLIAGITLVCLFSGWRTIDFMESFFKSPTKKTILYQLRCLKSDIISLFQIGIICILFLRIPETIYALYYIFKESRKRGDRILRITWYFKNLPLIFSRKRKIEQNVNFNDLPNELLFEVAKRMDYQSICRLQQTSKQFQWLDDQMLWKQKLEEHNFETNIQGISYKRLFENQIHNSNIRDKKTYQEYVYALGCRNIIKDKAILSTTTFHHNIFLPLKIYYYIIDVMLIICLYLCPVSKRSLFFSSRQHATFWNCHTIGFQMYTILTSFFIPRFIATYILYKLLTILWIIGTFGDRYHRLRNSGVKYFSIIFKSLYLIILPIHVVVVLLYSFIPVIGYYFGMIHYPILYQIIWFGLIGKKYSLLPQEYYFALSEFRKAKIIVRNWLAQESQAFKKFKQKAKMFISNLWKKISTIITKWYSTVKSELILPLYKTIKFIALYIWNRFYYIITIIKQCIMFIVRYIYNIIEFIVISVANILYQIGKYIGNLVYTIIMKILKILAFIWIQIKLLLQIIRSFIISIIYGSIYLVKECFQLYYTILAISTRYCSKLPSLIGNILIIPIAILWIFWPFIIAFYINLYLMLPCTFISGYFLLKGKRIIEKNW